MEHPVHEIELHDLSGAGSRVERIFACYLQAESRLCLARVPAPRLGYVQSPHSRTFPISHISSRNVVRRLTIDHQTRQNVSSIPWAPFQLHSIVLAVFASLVAPFGGFFASGFKRAFNIKDFGASIPGHGGLTDRMDCQFLMGLFTYVSVPFLRRFSAEVDGSRTDDLIIPVGTPR